MLVLVRGLPGSGKSTIAKSLPGFWHFEADQYFCLGTCYKFDPKLLPQAHAFCLSAATAKLAEANNVVVANTFTKQWEMQPYIDEAAKYEHEVLIIEALGNFENVHGVPVETINRMRERWEP